MDAKIQGVVVLDAVVEADGTVGDVTVARSLDAEYGLDEESIKAARQWRFEPGERDGKPVAVLVTVELTFTLR
jgi:TonB family protein